VKRIRPDIRTTLSCITLSALVGGTLRAQTTKSTPPEPPERVWASLGLGAGTGATFAGVISGWYSRGTFAMGVQYSEVQPFWITDIHSSAALLLGARTSGDRVFLVGGVGPAAARFQTDCNGACPLHQVGSQSPALGFSGQAVVNARILGLTFGTFGALGAPRVSYAGIALSVAAGWFGR